MDIGGERLNLGNFGDMEEGKEQYRREVIGSLNRIMKGRVVSVEDKKGFKGQQTECGHGMSHIGQETRLGLGI